MQISFPDDSLLVIDFVLFAEEGRTTTVLIYSKMFQIDALDLAVGSINIDGEIRTILAILCINSINLIFLLIAEFDSPGAKKIANLALFI